MTTFQKGELWGDGSGGAKALTTSFVAGTWQPTGTNSMIMCAIDISGTAPTNVDVMIEWSPDLGATVYPFEASAYDSDGAYLTDDGYYRLQGTLSGQRSLRISLPEYTYFRLSLRRVGGDATTSVFLEGHAKTPFSSGGGGGGGGSDGPLMVSASDSAVAEGNNSITGFADVALIKSIKVETSAVNWSLTIYSSDDYTSDPVVVASGRNGDWTIALDEIYQDGDATEEFHYNFTDALGSNTHDITVLGYALA